MHDHTNAAKSDHVHPIIAWMAIFNFALITIMMPTLIFAQGMDEHSAGANAPVKLRIEKVQPSACVQACYDSRNTCVATAANDNAMTRQCAVDGKECVKKCTQTAAEAKQQAREAYLEALKDAEKAYRDGMKKIREDYNAALKKAREDYAAAKTTAAGTGDSVK